MYINATPATIKWLKVPNNSLIKCRKYKYLSKSYLRINQLESSSVQVFTEQNRKTAWCTTLASRQTRETNYDDSIDARSTSRGVYTMLRCKRWIHRRISFLNWKNHNGSLSKQQTADCPFGRQGKKSYIEFCNHTTTARIAKLMAITYMLP